MFKSKGSHAKRQLFSGEDIIVRDSRIGRIYDLKVYGKSYQQDDEPTPDNPSEILNVPSEIDFINRSKNLLNLDSDSVAPPGFYTPEAGTSQPIYKNYDIIIGGTRNGYINPNRVTDVSIDPSTYSVTLKTLQAGYGVTFKIKNVVPGVTYVRNSQFIGLGAYDADGNLLSHTGGATLTAPEGTAFLVAVITSPPGQIATLQYPQVEQGTVPTAFVPYYRNVTPITIKDADNNLHKLCSVGDIRDEVNYTAGKIIKRVGEIVFDGDANEYWQMMALTLADFVIFYINLPSSAPDGNNPNNEECVCNRAIYDENYAQQNRCIIVGNQFRIYVPKEVQGLAFNNVDDWRYYLSRNHLIVQYELIVPREYDLHPDERLKNLTTFEGDNYITTETDNGVKPDLEFRAISYHYGK